MSGPEGDGGMRAREWIVGGRPRGAARDPGRLVEVPPDLLRAEEEEARKTN